MAGDVQTIVGSTVSSLGYELVDFELTSRGLLRVFIDKSDGISVEDCANVSNHLSRVFTVEAIEFERLEVSSPGLDRPLNSLEDFQRFVGRSAKVKLNSAVDGRKRFEGIIESVDKATIVFRLVDDAPAVAAAGVTKKSIKGGTSTGSKGKQAGPRVEKMLNVPHENIDRARLVPEI